MLGSNNHLQRNPTKTRPPILTNVPIAGRRTTSANGLLVDRLKTLIEYRASEQSGRMPNWTGGD